ncbi:MAG: arsenate reductase ArsC [Anaerolineae bacterium]|nr:arsenate reductase ArsC [Anaerolineae bacterium]
MNRQQVLFLCTGNSCRSQMAEGLVNFVLAHAWEAFSAGTHPSGYVHPLAVRAMAEIGIDISAQRSKSVDEYADATFDRVIAVCDRAAKNCPAWLGPGRVVHMSFPDPAQASGDTEERMAVFRQVRDDIRARVLAYLRQADDPTTEGFIYATGDV